MDLGDFVQLAGGASALIAAVSLAARQATESLAALAKARAAKLSAEAAQDHAGAKALEDALERVDKLEARVGELEHELVAERERAASERIQAVEDRRYLEGQVAVMQQELAAERRARVAAEERGQALASEMIELRNELHGGHHGLPTPLRPPPLKRG